MANLFFPQLGSGVLAQYPVRKTRIVRTVKNESLGGDVLAYADPGADRLIWQLGYSSLNYVDATSLSTFFNLCGGRFRGFTFMDPTENLLVSSTSLSGTRWQIDPFIDILSGAVDPTGGSDAFVVTNRGQTNQQIRQTLIAPSGYQYCFSVYAMSSYASSLVLGRLGSSANETAVGEIGPAWTRLVSSGRLIDAGTSLTVSINLTPGQQISLYGPQLEAQLAPSRFRPTFSSGGVYANAHWAVDALAISADAPNLFSVAFSIETSV